MIFGLFWFVPQYQIGAQYGIDDHMGGYEPFLIVNKEHEGGLHDTDAQMIENENYIGDKHEECRQEMQRKIEIHHPFIKVQKIYV